MATSGVSDLLVGRVLAGRYRLRAPIGAGASGRVYVADDVRLRRRVAVKVLHTALAHDSGFLRRFRAEAQLAASLHHPNVMVVYDWGEDEVPFMVLELLEGGSLRSMLDRDHRLTPAQAAHVGRQVAAALEYAHVRGLVHRDIKPANLLFDEHGIVRVGDFGLARALAEASWTEPAGALLGTARYASPEQASGTPLDARADLYALALVLVESVTGRVPFATDTPIGTLTARTRTGIHAPAELGALGAVVERAGQIDPDQRYPDAATMGSALADAAAALPPPGPLTLSGLHEVGDDQNPTQIGFEPVAPFDQDASDDTLAVEYAPVRTVPRRSGRAGAIVPLLVAGLVVLALALAGVAVVGASDAGGRVAVPNLAGVTREVASVRAAEAGVGVAVDVRQADEPAGTVVSQSPPAGSWIGRGGRVHLVVSSGPAPVAIPSFAANRAPSDVHNALLIAGFAVGPDERRNDENVPKDGFLGTDPRAGTKVTPGSTVRIVISNGPAARQVPPNLAGLTYDQAAAAIRAVHLQPVQATEFSDTIQAGRVTRTDPVGNTPVPRDSPVRVYVSQGPQLVLVPGVVGWKVEDASAVLQQDGLIADVRGYKPHGHVKTQSIPPNTKVHVGSTITLTL